VNIDDIIDYSARLRNLNGYAQVGMLTSSTGVSVTYTISILMQTLGYQNVDDALQYMTSSLTESVSSGDFLTTLQGYDATSTFATAEVGNVTMEVSEWSYRSHSPSAQPTNSPSGITTSSSEVDNKSIGTTTLIAVVVGVVGGVIIIACIVLCICLPSSKSKASPKDSGTELQAVYIR
jgi:hypothetical protein